MEDKLKMHITMSTPEVVCKLTQNKKDLSRIKKTYQLRNLKSLFKSI